jgi:uncharacterized protein (TIGR02996 family)
MEDEKGFLASLAENEDDDAIRLVYADWLEERGLYEEADRQRGWSAAKRWLVELAREHDDAWYTEEYGRGVTYKTLLDLGRQAVEDAGADAEGWYSMSCGPYESLCNALRRDCRAFWRNWSIVTGIPLPEDIADRSGFHCGC